MKTTTPHISNSMKHSSRDCRPVARFLIPLLLACLGLAPRAQAVGPDTDGSIPGSNNATGAYSLANNTDGNNNTANGYAALYRNTADGNTATGFAALYHNTTGFSNTATGSGALASNTMASNNTANGAQALVSNTIGFANTAIGRQTLHNNTSGSDNIALGAIAGFSLTTGDHNIDIGDTGVAGESGTIRIGNNIHTSQAFIAGISGVTVPGGVAVIIDASGHLGTTVSSARFKDEIKPMDKASEAILALKPVTFRYKKELDPNG